MHKLLIVSYDDIIYLYIILENNNKTKIVVFFKTVIFTLEYFVIFVFTIYFFENVINYLPVNNK